MRGTADETVGVNFDVDLLRAARDRTLDLINEVSALIEPGVSERDALAWVTEIQEQMSAERSWHAPQVRFGPHTLLPFGEKPAENWILQDNDIYFLDLGPVFAQHEGDVGRAFVVGDDSEHHRCVQDVEKIWHEVRTHWKTTGVSGADLYRFAHERARTTGWILALNQANGHRIADFPHAVRGRGSIEGFEQTPLSDRWILEIQIRHPSLPFGAFYEDLLN